MPVRQDKHGNWIFRTVVERPDGTRVRIYGMPGKPGPFQLCAQSEKGAVAAERIGIARALQGKPADDEKGAWQGKTIEQHAEKFVDLYKPETRESEKREKRRVLKSQLVPFFGKMRIESLEQTDVDRYTKSRLKTVSVKTVNNELAVLASLIKYVTGDEPSLRLKLKGGARKIHAVVSDDVEGLLAACDDPRDRVVVLLAGEAGLRAGEIRGVQWTDVRDGVVTIRRALEKQSNEVTLPKHDRIRTVPLSPRLVEALAALPRAGLWIVAEPDGEFITYDVLSRRVNAVYAAAKIDRPVKPLHCLRHSFGTALARRVALPVVRELMGHADIATTMQYVDVVAEQKTAAIASVFAVAADGSASNGLTK